MTVSVSKRYGSGALVTWYYNKKFLNMCFSGVLALYFYWRHNEYCEPYVYSFFGGKTIRNILTIVDVISFIKEEMTARYIVDAHFYLTNSVVNPNRDPGLANPQIRIRILKKYFEKIVNFFIKNMLRHGLPRLTLKHQEKPPVLQREHSALIRTFQRWLIINTQAI